MDQSQKAAFIDAAEAAFAQVGVPDIYAGAAQLKGLFDRAYPHIVATLSRESLEAYFESTEAIQEEEFEKMAALFLAIPQILKRVVTDAMTQAVEALPRKVGPPVRITPEEKRSIISHVSRLYSNGVSIGDAQRQAGLHFSRSLRSVQRVWQQRKELAQQRFLNIEDILRFLGK